MLKYTYQWQRRGVLLYKKTRGCAHVTKKGGNVMKKSLLLTGAAVMAMMAASMTVSAEPTEITLWHYFDASADAQAIVDWVDEYNLY